MYGISEVKKFLNDAPVMSKLHEGHYADDMNNIWLYAEDAANGGVEGMWNVSVRYPADFPDKGLFAKHGGGIVARNLPLEKALLVAKGLYVCYAAKAIIYSVLIETNN